MRAAPRPRLKRDVPDRASSEARRCLLGAPSLLFAALVLGCSAGPPALCAEGLPDGGCSYHVEVHCGDDTVCSPGSVQVLDAGTCTRDTAADVIDCT
jgi:hypothetical protein